MVSLLSKQKKQGIFQWSWMLEILGRFSKNVQIHVTEFYLLEKALNSNWKWFHQTQHNVMNKRDFTEGIEVLRVLRKICLIHPKCHIIACNSAAIASPGADPGIFVRRGPNFPKILKSKKIIIIIINGEERKWRVAVLSLLQKYGLNRLFRQLFAYNFIFG